MTIRLTTLSTPPVPNGAHQGFQQGPSPQLDHHAGFGPGNHYTLEVRTPGRMHVLPGATTVVWYVAPETDGGWTASAIESAESLPGGSVNEAWLRGQTTTVYGLQSDHPLAFDDFASIGRELRRWVEENSNGESPWFMFKAGNPYSDFLEFWPGESALHPSLVSDYGTGTRPLFTAEASAHTLQDPPPNHLVTQGIEFSKQQSSNIGNGVKNWLFSDCTFDTDHHGITASQFSRFTLYACTIIDCTFEVPQNGITWNLERGSGSFMSRFEGKLSWCNFFDKNGWDESYNPDGVTWNNGEFGQPPHFYNHHDYTQKDSSDVSYLMTVSTRAPFSADQARSGGYANVVVRVENNAGGNFGDGTTEILLKNRVGTFIDGGKLRGQTSGNEYDISFGNGYEFGLIRLSPVLPAGVSEPFTPGETVIGTDAAGTPNGASGVYSDYDTSVIPRGNFSYISHMLTMGAGYKDGAINIGQRDKAQNGFPTVPYTARYVRAANGIDPHNAAEATVKSGFETTTNSGLSAAEMQNAFFDDVKIHNWGSSANDRNLEGLTPNELDKVTLGGWNDDRLSQAIGTSTTVDAINHLRTLRNPGLLASAIWSYAALAFDDPVVGHESGATAIFKPDLAGDGFRMDGINNWSIDGQPDYPKDGDGCDLDDNLAYNFMTWRFADLNFGTVGTGGVRMYGGFISCTSAQGDGSIDLRESGQFYFAGSNEATIDVMATGGRLGFTGADVGGSINVDLHNAAQLFVQGGSSASVQNLTINGSDVKVGFDGTSGKATLTVTGSLNFTQAPTIQEYRSGDHGLIDLGGDITGQPVEPSVESEVILAENCVVSVDTSGLTIGQYILIDVDMLKDEGAALPDNLALQGGKLVLTVG